MFSKVVTVTSVIAKQFGTALPDFIETIEPSQIIFQKILQMNVDAGEASAIALALECKAPLIIIDDIKARKIAEELNLNITGTLGVLIEATKELGDAVLACFTSFRCCKCSHKNSGSL